MTTRDADRILVMDEGRIVEEGTHQELMEARGLQCEMYSTQAAKFRSEGVKRSLPRLALQTVGEYLHFSS